jgi:hypothetical protein
MKLTTAIGVLKKECEFLGLTMPELLDELEKAPLSFPLRTIEAYKAYKADYEALERRYA